MNALTSVHPPQTHRPLQSFSMLCHHCKFKPVDVDLFTGQRIRTDSDNLRKVELTDKVVNMFLYNCCCAI